MADYLQNNGGGRLWRMVILDSQGDDRAFAAALLRGEKQWKLEGIYASRAAAEASFRRAKPDLAIVDLQTAGAMDWFYKFAALVPGAKTIVTTTELEPRLLCRALEAGAWGYVGKPLSAIELIGAVKTVIDGGCYIPPWLLAELFKTRRSLGELRRSWLLTRRETVVLELLSSGASRGEVCLTMNVGEAGLRSHLLHIYQKMGVHSEASAISKFLGGRFFV